MKPWLKEPRGRQLEAFLGVWGIKTSEIETTNDLIADACTLYGIPITLGITVDAIARQIDELGRKERRVRVEANIGWFKDRQPTSEKTEQPITTEALENMMASSQPKLVDGSTQDCVGELDIDPVRLLRKVVSAVVSHDQGHILYEFPELLEFLGSRIPSREDAGNLGVDERMFKAKAKWPNLMPGASL